MKIIYKWQIPMDSAFELLLPEGATILSGQIQRGTATIWILVEETPLRSKYRQFRLIATGEEFDDTDMSYVTTFLFSGGDFVFHLFEVKEKSTDLTYNS